jgi:protein-S-isoprenylcysteine O-methyltransferase Ste14
MVYLKTAIFTIIVPGTVTILVPRWFLSRWPGPHEPDPLTAPIGAVFIVAGVVLYVWCAFNFSAIGRGTPSPIDPPRALVARGPYAVVRNPIYVAIVTSLFGEAIFFRASVLAVYAALMFIATFAFVVLYEEPTLRRKFGTPYERYLREVPRWLPRKGAVPWKK